VVDFFCAEDRLVIELDGEVHDHPSRARRDSQRRQFLESLDLRVLRFGNEDVLTDPELVLNQIQTFLNEKQTSRT